VTDNEKRRRVSDRFFAMQITRIMYAGPYRTSFADNPAQQTAYSTGVHQVRRDTRLLSRITSTKAVRRNFDNKRALTKRKMSNGERKTTSKFFTRNNHRHTTHKHRPTYRKNTGKNQATSQKFGATRIRIFALVRET